MLPIYGRSTSSRPVKCWWLNYYARLGAFNAFGVFDFFFLKQCISKFQISKSADSVDPSMKNIHKGTSRDSLGICASRSSVYSKANEKNFFFELQSLEETKSKKKITFSSTLGEVKFWNILMFSCGWSVQVSWDLTLLFQSELTS